MYFVACLQQDEYIDDLMSAHVLLNLLNELGKRNKMQGLPRILSLFRNELFWGARKPFLEPFSSTI